jgi:hypothetical protein
MLIQYVALVAVLNTAIVMVCSDDVCVVWCDDKRKALSYDAHYDVSWRWLTIMPFEKNISVQGHFFLPHSFFWHTEAHFMENIQPQ